MTNARYARPSYRARTFNPPSWAVFLTICLIVAGVLSLFTGFHLSSGIPSHTAPHSTFTTHVTMETAPPAPRDTWKPITPVKIPPKCTNATSTRVTVDSKGQQSTTTTVSRSCG